MFGEAHIQCHAKTPRPHKDHPDSAASRPEGDWPKGPAETGMTDKPMTEAATPPAINVFRRDIWVLFQFIPLRRCAAMS
jgi:hypothetical protein